MDSLILAEKHVVTHLVLLWRVERIPQYRRSLYWHMMCLVLFKVVKIGDMTKTSPGVVFQVMECASADGKCSCVSHLPRPRQLSDDTVGSEAEEVASRLWKATLRCLCDQTLYMVCVPI